MATESLTIDQRTKVTLVTTIEDTDAPTATELGAGQDIHCQIQSGFDPSPDTKEYDAGSFCTGGQDVMVLSDQVNFGTLNLVMKERDTTAGTDAEREAFADAEFLVWAVRDAHQSEDWAADDLATIMPINAGLDVDLPAKEGVRTYGRKLTYDGNGKNRVTVVSGA